MIQEHRCKTLAQAVLLTFIKDCFRTGPDISSADKRSYDENWAMVESLVPNEDFIEICYNAGANPSIVKQKLLEFKNDPIMSGFITMLE